MKSFEGDFPLVSSVDDVKGRNITMPDGIRYDFTAVILKVFVQIFSFRGYRFSVRQVKSIILSKSIDDVYFHYRREQFVQWVDKLAENQTPSWLGLPNNAEKVLLTTQGIRLHLYILLVIFCAYSSPSV